MWLAHLGLKDDTVYRTTMEIDFERYMVVAIFGGKTVNSHGHRVEEVRGNNTTVFLRFSNIAYQTGNGVDEMTPYTFVVLRGSGKPVVLEETTHTMDGQHLTRVVGRLSPPEK
ncbi:MAG: hypothetical protein ACQESR_21680 [Planctomycetota bacterium]